MMMMMMMMMLETVIGKASPDNMQKREKEHLNRVSVVTQVVYLSVSVSLSCGFTHVSLLLVARLNSNFILIRCGRRARIEICKSQ